MSLYCDVMEVVYSSITGGKSSFFFQAEDGIRYDLVTGVQTCALPISDRKHRMSLSCPMQTATRCFRRSAVRRDRKSVVWGKSVDLGGRRIIKKKKRDCELFIIRIYNWYMSNYTCKM